jgi:ATP-dependent DNA helicase RecG
MKKELSRTEMQQLLGLNDKQNFKLQYLSPALTSGTIEMTFPEKPQSSKQKYRITSFGIAIREKR